MDSMQMGEPGRVMVCSAKNCSYNQNAKCVAESVQVNLHNDHADCNTYTENQHRQTTGQMGEASAEQPW
jgi:hypothetical protein